MTSADPVGIPVIFFSLLVRQRSVINPTTDASLKESSGAEHVVVSMPSIVAHGVRYSVGGIA